MGQPTKTKEQEMVIDGEFFEVLPTANNLLSKTNNSRSGVKIKSAQDLRDDFKQTPNPEALRDFGRFVKA